jgi:hypothetical protein
VKDIGSLSIEKCARGFQRDFGTCGHWSIVFLLYILSNVESHKEVFTSSRPFNQWCDNIFKTMSTWSDLDHTMLIADISQIFYSYINQIMIKPVFNHTDNMRKFDIISKLEEQYNVLTPLLSSETSLQYPSQTIPKSTVMLFNAVMKGMIKRMPMSVNDDDEDTEKDE